MNSTAIYNGDKTGFTLFQKLNESSKTAIVDLTADGNWLLVVNQYGSAFVYQRQNTSFELFQNISMSDGSYESHAGALTDDH